MRIEWLRLELRMELAAKEPRMVGRLNNLHVVLVRRPPGNLQSRRRQNLFVFAIEFVAVPVPFADLNSSVSLVCKRSRLQLARPGAQPHCAAHFVHAQQRSEEHTSEL